MTALNAQVHLLDAQLAEGGHEDALRDRNSEVGATRDALRAQAAAHDTTVTTYAGLASIWHELGQGASQVLDGFFSEERCYLLLAPKTNGVRKPIETRRLEILESVLRGLPQKSIAIDHRLAPSTIALHSKLALETLGVVGRPSRAHPLLMLTARSCGRSTEARCSLLATDSREIRVISMRRPERILAPLLPMAELEVVRSLIEGLSYEEIAQQRRTSARTVANQISAVFRRLRVSGRNALVEYLFVQHEVAKRRSSARDPRRSGVVERLKLGSAPVATADGIRRSPKTSQQV
jgi:DNA-binding NarL/FixJ family response regulator